MARKTETIVIEDEGRDKGKVFVITELSSYAAEKWALRALLALTKAGFELPDGAQSAGMAGMASVGFEALGNLDFDVAEPLLDEMWQCIKFKPSEGAMPRAVLQGDNGDIEEVKTRISLRMAVFKLHVGFS